MCHRKVEDGNLQIDDTWGVLCTNPGGRVLSWEANLRAFVSLSLETALLPMHDFETQYIGHLEDTGSLSHTEF